MVLILYSASFTKTGGKILTQMTCYKTTGENLAQLGSFRAASGHRNGATRCKTASGLGIYGACDFAGE
jgi:hypothetical protein